jgi:hypothetical protein
MCKAGMFLVQQAQNTCSHQYLHRSVKSQDQVCTLSDRYAARQTQWPHCPRLRRRALRRVTSWMLLYRPVIRMYVCVNRWQHSKYPISLTLTLSLSHSLSLSLSLSLTHSHSLTHSLTHSLSHSHTHTHTHRGDENRALGLGANVQGLCISLGILTYFP